MNFYSTILVAIDLSQYSDETLKKSLLLAEKLGSILYLIHVVEPLPIGAYSFLKGAEIEQHMLKTATLKMETKGLHYEIPQDQQCVVLGSPKSVILEKAKAINAELIVVGNHNQRGLMHLLGSTAASIVNNADCDVLVMYTNTS